MAVIEGGNVITGGNVMAGTGPRIFRGAGAPVAGTTYAGRLSAGDLYVDVDNDDVYEFTTGPDAFTRRDTV